MQRCKPDDLPSLSMPTRYDGLALAGPIRPIKSSLRSTPLAIRAATQCSLSGFRPASTGRRSAAHRPLFEIAAEIKADWTTRHGAATPYVLAMDKLRDATDQYGTETGSDMIRGFLNSAQTWRGPVAQRVKDELRAILRDYPAP